MFDSYDKRFITHCDNIRGIFHSISGKDFDTEFSQDLQQEIFIANKTKDDIDICSYLYKLIEKLNKIDN